MLPLRCSAYLAAAFQNCLARKQGAALKWAFVCVCVCVVMQVTLQDSLTRAVIELPGLTADVLQQEYRAHNPKLLPVVQNLLSPPGSSS